MCIIYKDGWNTEGRPKWATQLLFTPIYQTIIKAKEAFCAKLVINTTPCLENCRPRLFAAVSDLISALSSDALPFLKKKFFAGSSNNDSLNMEEFTECLFLQLYESHPKIIEEVEAPFAVAMIQEMFLQIDYNGDGHSTWNEFTTFLSITGRWTVADPYQHPPYHPSLPTLPSLILTHPLVSLPGLRPIPINTLHTIHPYQHYHPYY